VCALGREEKTHRLPVALLLLVALKIILGAGLLAAHAVLYIVGQHAHGSDHERGDGKGGEDVEGAYSKAILASLPGKARGGGAWWGVWGRGVRREVLARVEIGAQGQRTIVRRGENRIKKCSNRTKGLW